jgi:hypothetical protein
MADDTGSEQEPAGTGRARKLIKPVAAVVGVLATMASIWWFALKPRRKPKD